MADTETRRRSPCTVGDTEVRHRSRVTGMEDHRPVRMEVDTVVRHPEDTMVVATRRNNSSSPVDSGVAAAASAPVDWPSVQAPVCLAAWSLVTC
jgi:hypothetical protein